MLFPTLEFAIFLAVALALSWATRGAGLAWRGLLLGLSWVFYGWWDWRFVGLLGASTLVNQALVCTLDRQVGGRRRAVLALAVAFNLALLGLFKYADFFLLSVEATAAALGWGLAMPLLDWALPVGVSFFTFEALSYAIDVYRRAARPARLVDFGLYLSFFPHLVAGPLVRVGELIPQLEAPPPVALEAPRAARLILVGLVKKVLIADTLAGTLVDPVFTNPTAASAAEAALALYGYAAQILCDFSAYTDIALGVSLLFGLSLPENFDRPYAAQSFQEFWRRWHITLSRWLRDYLYLPLGGSRGGAGRTAANLLITMLLGGLWHGADWRFVLWGALHGLFLVGERALGLNRPPQPGPVGLLRAQGVFHLVALSWVLFRAPSLDEAWAVLSALGSGGLEAPRFSLPVALALMGALGGQALPARLGPALDRAVGRLPPVVFAGLVAFALMAIDALGPDGVAAFIYFQF